MSIPAFMLENKRIGPFLTLFILFFPIGNIKNLDEGETPQLQCVLTAVRMPAGTGPMPQV